MGGKDGEVYGYIGCYGFVRKGVVKNWFCIGG